MVNIDDSREGVTVRVRECDDICPDKLGTAGIQIAITPVAGRLEGHAFVLLSPDADTTRRIARELGRVTYSYRRNSASNSHSRCLHIHATIRDKDGRRYRIRRNYEFTL